MYKEIEEGVYVPNVRKKKKKINWRNMPILIISKSVKKYFVHYFILQLKLTMKLGYLLQE